MAVKYTTILSVIIPLAFIIHSHLAFELDDPEDYTIDDHFLSLNLRSGSRFHKQKIKKGAHCNVQTNNICAGISVNNGTGLLQCCKKHCRNVLGDRNNCGSCGHKCGFSQLCCGGTCNDVAYNVNHCGKCDKKCQAGVKCEFGTCGYAWLECEFEGSVDERENNYLFS